MSYQSLMVFGWIAKLAWKESPQHRHTFLGGFVRERTAKNAMSEMMAAEKPTFFGMFLGTAFLAKKIALLAVSTIIGASFVHHFSRIPGQVPI